MNKFSVKDTEIILNIFLLLTFTSFIVQLVNPLGGKGMELASYIQVSI